MNEVVVSKLELITKLKENRDKHAQLYKDAMEGYFVETAKKLRAALAKIEKADKPITSMNFTVPQDHTEQYDEVLAMLEMSVEDDIELTRHEFNNYVLDKWISMDEKRAMRGFAMSSSNSAHYMSADLDD